MTIPEAAIEAAAEAFRDQFNGWFYDDTRFIPCTWMALAETSKQAWRDHARAALEAAMPAIREALAQELGRCTCDTCFVAEACIADGCQGDRIARGGTP